VIVLAMSVTHPLSLHFMVLWFIILASVTHSHEKKHLKHPNIFIIGAMKAGTTSLSDLMRKNRAICDKGEKEKHFFNGADYKNKYHASLEKYADEFKGCGADQLTLDATPGYSEKSNVNDRMKESYSTEDLAKKYFIFSVREPISRHYSEYEMDVRFCLDTIGDLNRTDQTAWRKYRHERACESVMSDFNSKTNDPTRHSKAKVFDFHQWCLSEHGRRELMRGHYKEAIQRFLNMIKRSQFFIINFDTLVRNTSTVMQGMGEFLNLKEEFKWNSTTSLAVPKKSGATMNLEKMSCSTVKMLENYFYRVNGGNIAEWVRNITISNGSSIGEPIFEDFVSNPYKNCNEKLVFETDQTRAFTEESLAVTSLLSSQQQERIRSR